MKSPCIELCSFDGRTGWCRGCGRTKPECRSWRKAQPHQLRSIAADLPRRLKKLGNGATHDRGVTTDRGVTERYGR